MKIREDSDGVDEEDDQQQDLHLQQHCYAREALHPLLTELTNLRDLVRRYLNMQVRSTSVRYGCSSLSGFQIWMSLAPFRCAPHSSLHYCHDPAS